MLEVERPELWWPNGLGEQRLYRVRELGIDVGFRTIELVRTRARRRRAAVRVRRQRRARCRSAAGTGCRSTCSTACRGRRSSSTCSTLARARERQPAARVGRRPDRDAASSTSSATGSGSSSGRSSSQSSSGIESVPSDDPEFVATLVADARADRAAAAPPSVARGLVRRQRARRADDSTPVLGGAARRRARARSRSARGCRPRRPGRARYDVHGPWEHQGLRAHYEHYDTRTSLLHSEFGVEGMTNRRALEALIAPEHRWPADRTNPVYEHLGAWWNNATLVQEAFGGRIDDVETMRRASQWLQYDGLRYAVEAQRRRRPRAAGRSRGSSTSRSRTRGARRARRLARRAEAGVLRRRARLPRRAERAVRDVRVGRARRGARAGVRRRRGSSTSTAASSPRRTAASSRRRSTRSRTTSSCSTSSAQPLRDDAHRRTSRRCSTCRGRAARARRDGGSLRNVGDVAALGVVLEDARAYDEPGWVVFSDNVLDLLPGEEREIASTGRSATARGGLECSRASALAPDGSPVDGFAFDGAHACATRARRRSTRASASRSSCRRPTIRSGSCRASSTARTGRQTCTRIYPALHAGPRRRRADGVRRVVVPRRPLRDAGRLRARRRARHDASARRSASPASASPTATARPTIWLDFPYREEPLRYDGSRDAAAAGRPDVPLAAGRDASSSTFRSSDGDWRAALRGRGAVRRTAAWVSVEEAAELAACGLYRWHFRADPPRLIETRSLRRRSGERDDMHVSWVSGVPVRVRAPAARAPRRQRRATSRAAEAVLDHVAANLTPGGTFWPQWTRDRGWTWGWHPDHDARPRAHARRRDALHAPRRRPLGARRALERRRRAPHAARRRRAPGGALASRPATPSRGRGRPACRGSRRSSRRATSRRRGAPARTTRGFDTWYGAPEDVDLAPTLRGRLRGRHGVRRARGLGDRAPCRRLDAHLPLHVRRATSRRTRSSAATASARAAPTRRRRRTSTCTRSGCLPARARAARRATGDGRYRRDGAREPRLLPPVHRARGRRLRRAQGDGGRALPTRPTASARRGRCSRSRTRGASASCCYACEEVLAGVKRFPDGFLWGVATSAFQIEGARRRRRPRAVDLGHVLAHAGQDRQRRHGRRRVRPLPPLARGRRPDRVARRQRVPLLDRVAAHLPDGPRPRRAARARPLRPADRRAARARDRAGRDALPLGPAAGARGRGRLAQPRHGRALRRVRARVLRRVRRPRRAGG